MAALITYKRPRFGPLKGQYVAHIEHLGVCAVAATKDAARELVIVLATHHVAKQAVEGSKFLDSLRKLRAWPPDFTPGPGLARSRKAKGKR